jgi:hypothetical protein
MNPEDDRWKKYQELLELYEERNSWPDKYKHFEDAFYDFGFNRDGQYGKKYTYDIARELNDTWGDFDINDIEEAQDSGWKPRPPCLTIFKAGDLVQFYVHNVYDDAEQLVKAGGTRIGLVIEVEPAKEEPDVMALVIDSTTQQHRWILVNDLEIANG